MNGTTTTTTVTTTTTTTPVDPNQGIRIDIQPFVDESPSMISGQTRTVVRWTARIETADHSYLIREHGAGMREVLREVEKFLKGLKRYQRKGVSYTQMLMVDDMWTSAQNLGADFISQ